MRVKIKESPGFPSIEVPSWSLYGAQVLGTAKEIAVYSAAVSKTVCPKFHWSGSSESDGIAAKANVGARNGRVGIVSIEKPARGFGHSCVRSVLRGASTRVIDETRARLVAFDPVLDA
eukprot:4615078-Pleurochrysis_carterae.AAC.1